MVSMPEKVKNPTQGLNVEARPKQSTTRMDVPVPHNNQEPKKSKTKNHSCGRRKLLKGPVEFVKYTSVAQVCLTYGIVGGTLQWYVVFSKFSC